MIKGSLLLSAPIVKHFQAKKNSAREGAPNSLIASIDSRSVGPVARISNDWKIFIPLLLLFSITHILDPLVIS